MQAVRGDAATLEPQFQELVDKQKTALAGSVPQCYDSCLRMLSLLDYVISQPASRREYVFHPAPSLLMRVLFFVFCLTAFLFSFALTPAIRTRARTRRSLEASRREL